MNLFYERLQRPKYVFSGDKKYLSAFQGLRTSGPYDLGTCPKEPRILFVYPTELRELARLLYFSLKNGIGPFLGTEALLKYRLVAKNIERLTEFSVQVWTIRKQLRFTKRTFNDTSPQNTPCVDIALILHRKTSHHVLDNPYLSSKFPLLQSNIPTQVVTSDLLGQESAFQWSAANIALALFAKMGGRPWAIETGLSEDSIVVGINRAIVPSPSGRSKRIYGFASTFSHNGIYLGTKLFSPKDGWDAYLKGLECAVTAALEEWKETYGTPANFVLHVRKNVRKEETDIISRCLARFGDNNAISYAVLKLVDSDHMLVFSRSDAQAFNPPPGLMVYLASHRAILQIAGYDPMDQFVGKRVTTRPWHVTQLMASASAPHLSVLCCHILALAAMNWRGLNAEASPVSVQYPALVADLLGRFGEAGFDVGTLCDLSVMERTWFI